MSYVALVVAWDRGGSGREYGIYKGGDGKCRLGGKIEDRVGRRIPKMARTGRHDETFCNRV